MHIHKAPFQYIEDELDTYVHAITITNLPSTNLPLTNPNMIDWNFQDTPKVVIALFGLKSIQYYEHMIQYNEEAYFGSQVNSLSSINKK